MKDEKEFAGCFSRLGWIFRHGRIASLLFVSMSIAETPGSSASLPPTPEKKKMKKSSMAHLSKRAKKQKLPPGWTEEQIKEVLDYYENQTEEEQAAEHEAALKAEGQTVMTVPTELVPEIRKLIAKKCVKRGA